MQGRRFNFFLTKVDVINDRYRLHWYDWGRGWDETAVGWYHHSVFAQTATDTDKLHREVVTWLYETIDAPEKHCRWVRIANEVSVKFRYERDYLWFKLSF